MGPVDGGSGAVLYVKTKRDKPRHDIKFDRVGMLEAQSEASWSRAPTSNGNPASGRQCGGVGEGEGAGDSLDSLQSLCSSLEWEVKEIRRHLKAAADRAASKEDMEKRAREWKVVALVLDRLFFFIYLLILFVSAFTLFKTTLVQEGAVASDQDHHTET